MAKAQDQLWELALDQHGYVTADDARAIGIAPHVLRLLAQRGTLSHEAWGVYRFERFPLSATDDYRLAVLWTGHPLAALSHETALDLYGLAQVNPDRIHLTVPTNARIRRQGGDYVVVHKENLRSADVGWWQNIRCVSPATAIRQVIDAGNTQIHLVWQALESSHDLGVITNADYTNLKIKLEKRFV